MKKVISVFLVFSIVCSLLSLSVSAASLPSITPTEYPTYGTIGGNIHWKVSNSTLEITGTGAIPSYTPDSYCFLSHTTCPPWHPHIGKFSKVTIGEGITELGSKMFHGSSSLEVELPSTLEKINNSENFCYSVEKITLSSMNKHFTLEEGALYDKNKTEIIFYATDTTNSNRAFFNVPETVTTIRSGAFYQNNSLEEITILPTVTTIEENAFSHYMNEVNFMVKKDSAIYNYIQNSEGTLTATLIPDNALIAGTLHIYDGDYLSYILYDTGELSFLGHGTAYHFDDTYETKKVPWYNYIDKVKSVMIEEGVENLPNYMLDDIPNLETLHIPSTLGNLGTYATVNCPNFMEFTVSPDNDTYYLHNGALYSKNGGFHTMHRLPPARKDTTYSPYYMISSISGTSFADCDALISVSLPKELADSDYGISTATFYRCKNIEAINFPEAGLAYKSGDGVVYSSRTDALLIYPRNKKDKKFVVPIATPEIGTSAFASNENLEEIVLQTGLHIIDTSAFSHTKIKSVHIPASVEKINSSAFSSCKALSSVTFEESGNDITIGRNAFAFCDALTEINFPGRVKTIDSRVFEKCSSLHTVTMADGVKEIKEKAFISCPVLKNVTIPGSVETIGTEAFYDLAELENVTIGDGVKTIGSSAFSRTAIKELYLPNSITSIDSGAFNTCTQLRNINIPTSITLLSSTTFGGCTSLKNIVVPSNITKLGSAVFSGCTGLESAVIEGPISRIESYTFNNCTSLKSLTIPDTVNYIGYGAFKNCDSLESITVTEGISEMLPASEVVAITLEIPDTITVVGQEAFADCDQIEKIIIPGSITSFDASAFKNCINLKEVVFEEGVTTITGKFEGCTNIEKIYIPETVTSIAQNIVPGSNAAVINGEKGSYAENYAKSYNLAFKYHATVITTLPVISDITVACMGYYTLQPTLEATTENGEKIALSVSYSSRPSTNYPHTETVIATFTIPENYVLANGLSDSIRFNVNVVAASASGECGDGVFWKLENQVLTISGLGAMYDYSEDKKNLAPWYEYVDQITTVIVEGGVTTLGDCTLLNCINLSSVTLPAEITRIGDKALYNTSPRDIYFGGSKKQWDLIIIGADNDYLAKTSVHYAVADDTLEITVQIPEYCIIEEEATAFVVVYDKGGIISEIKLVPVGPKDYEVNAQISGNSQSVKMLIWKDKTPLSPILEKPVEQKITQ